MKKHLLISFFLAFGLTQSIEAQTKLSQFSLPTAQAHSRITPLGTAAKTRLARSRPNLGNPPVNPVGFVSAVQIPGGGATSWSAVDADFNGDGKLDIAAPVQTGTSSFAVSVVLSNGNGTFSSAQLTANPNGVSGDQILAGDFNGDGKEDLIVVHATGPATFEVWLGNGDGTFNVQSNALTTITASHVVGGVVTDVNGDGKLDLVFVDAQSPANVWTLLGSGTGTFQTPTSIALTGGSLSNVVFADFNGDGILDLAASFAGSNGVNVTYQNEVYLGKSGGGYQAAALLSNPDGVYNVCNNSTGDLNGDGKPEIVSANCFISGPAGSLTVYVNNGDGTFKTGVYYSPGTEPTDSTDANISPLAVTIADVNGDGKNDIVSSNHNGGDVTVLMGNGDGTVNVSTEGYSTGGSPKTSALVADFNGDGFVDIVVPDDSFSFAYLEGYGDGTFRAALDYYSPVPGGFDAGGTTIASGDFNGDGYPDFVVGNYGYNPNTPSGIGVTVFLSNSDGSLKPGVNYGTGGSYQGVTVGEFNGDSKLDIAAVNQSNDGVQIFHGNGDGTFALDTFYPTLLTEAHTIVTGDFNGDGHPDLAVLNSDSQTTLPNITISVLLSNGAGGFQTAALYVVNSSVGFGEGIAAVDVNNDGILDLVVTEQNPGIVAVLLGKGDGTFQPPLTTAFNYNQLGNLTLGDLDGDGKVDVAVAVDDPLVGTGVAIAKGNGDGTFQTAVLYSTTLQNPALNLPLPGDVKMIDLNGDGKLDLVYSNSAFGTVGVLYNTGTNPFAAGMFYDPVEYSAGSEVYALALVDVNQDGAVDVVMADDFYAGATVLLNASGNVSTIASSVNPVALGQSTTFTATVATKVRGVSTVPTGNVTFLDGSTSLGAAALSGGVAKLTTSSLTMGTHSITAQYAGDSNFHSSTSTVLSEVVTGPQDFAVTANPSSVTVKAGSPAQYPITVTPSNGYAGTVTFSCVSNTLPSKTTCSFSPSSISPSSGTYATVTLTLSTTAATASLVVPAQPNAKPGAPSLWAGLSSFGIFSLVLAGIGRKRGRRQMAIVLGMVLVLAMFTLVGCGGSNNSSTPPITNPGVPGTPSGSYPVTVTAAGTGIGTPTHTMTVTLVVQ
jgi:hypothetical protein